MKFRAIINDPAHMQELHAIITMLSKINKDTVCLIEPNVFSFVVAENYVQGTPWIWSEIGSTALFSEYVMEGVDAKTNNKIVMSFNSIKLCNAMSMLAKGPARYVKLKLTNRQFPCLTVELETASSSSDSGLFRKIMHEVPMTLIPTREWSEFDIPSLSQHSRSISLPSVRSMRNLVDKIKNLSPSMTVYYNNVGELSLVVETDLATVSSQYRNLSVTKHPAKNDPQDTAGDVEAEDEVSCRINSKQLAMLLASNQLQHANMSCNIHRDVSLRLRLEIRPKVSVNCVLFVVAT